MRAHLPSLAAQSAGPASHSGQPGAAKKEPCTHQSTRRARPSAPILHHEHVGRVSAESRCHRGMVRARVGQFRLFREVQHGTSTSVQGRTDSEVVRGTLTANAAAVAVGTAEALCRIAWVVLAHPPFRGTNGRTPALVPPHVGIWIALSKRTFAAHIPITSPIRAGLIKHSCHLRGKVLRELPHWGGTDYHNGAAIEHASTCCRIHPHGRLMPARAHPLTLVHQLAHPPLQRGEQRTFLCPRDDRDGPAGGARRWATWTQDHQVLKAEVRGVCAVDAISDNGSVSRWHVDDRPTRPAERGPEPLAFAGLAHGLAVKLAHGRTQPRRWRLAVLEASGRRGELRHVATVVSHRRILPGL